MARVWLLLSVCLLCAALSVGQELREQRDGDGEALPSLQPPAQELDQPPPLPQEEEPEEMQEDSPPLPDEQEEDILDDDDGVDEDSGGRSDACAEAMSSLCKLGDSYTFEESLRCLESHVSELQGACSSALNVMMSNLYTDCSDAVASLCPLASSSSSDNGDESVYVLSCLSNHEKDLSADCQQQLDTYLHEEYPCTKEAALFCSQKSSSSPEKTLECLETIASTSPEDISLECATVLNGFSSCKGNDGEDKRDNGKPNPKPKPRASSRLLASDNANADTDLFEDDMKPKPKPKPKRGPGNEGDDRRCWKSSGGNDGGFLGAYDNLFSSGSDKSYDNDHSTGIMVSSLIVVLALVGVVGVKYRKMSQENMGTNGYWRAPSIQAMLYDDSGHSGIDSSSSYFINDSNERTVIGQVVEMDDLSKSSTGPRPSVEAIQVTVSPITSDDIRV